MSELTKTPLNEFSHAWNFLPQVMETSTNYLADNRTLNIHTETMIEVPGTMDSGGTLIFQVEGNCIEGNELNNAVDVQFPWEEHPKRKHKRWGIEIPTLLVDRYPVTNADYKTFLLESGWFPETRQNWLNHWIDYDDYPEGYDMKPVIWVSHNDAAVYCYYYKRRQDIINKLYLR